MFTMALARRLAGSTVTANCLDSGFNATGLGRELRFADLLERSSLGFGRVAAGPRGSEHRVPQLLQLDRGQAQGWQGRTAAVPIPQGQPAATALRAAEEPGTVVCAEIGRGLAEERRDSRIVVATG
jgi:hypothetical protein